jgi:alpha-D-ribose 1-methylphosphonate 5-triphosphate synthase subunit PhnG
MDFAMRNTVRLGKESSTLGFKMFLGTKKNVSLKVAIDNFLLLQKSFNKHKFATS